jgi:hypothetical protein
MAVLSYPLPRQFPITRGFADASIISAGGFGGLGAHTGLDLGAPCGEPVLAAGPGVVSKVWTGAAALLNAGGRHIVVTHSDALMTEYMHLSVVYVRVGQVVGAGAVIGSVGASGAATGCHLHFQVDLNGQAVDPGPYLGIGSTVPAGSAAGNVLAGTGGTVDYGPIYPLLESEVAAWAASSVNPCAPGYRLSSVDPRINFLLDNPLGSGPKGAHWFQAPLLSDHPDWAAKGGASIGGGIPFNLGPLGVGTSGLRFACTRDNIQPGNVNMQQIGLALPALLEPALNLAILGTAAVLIFAGIRQATNG